MNTHIGTDIGSYTFNAAGKTVTITDMGVNPITLEDILAIIHPGTGTILYQLGRPSVAAAAFSTTVGGCTITLNASVSTAGMNNSDPLYIAVEAYNGGNVTTKFREAFESYTPGVKWNQVKASGDIVQVDGNAVGASYLVISKDPLVADNLTTVETIANFRMPIETAVGLHRSQATLGQEFAYEIVDVGTPITTPGDLTITSIQQATTTLTISTSAAHGLVPGKRIQIYGCTSDSRLNYNALVVATVPSTTQFTATAGPGGTIPSLTVGPFATGMVSYRLALGGAQNGASQLFENATATNASFYVRSESGDSFPSGTLNGNHAITVGTTASVAAVATTAYTYAFQPTNEFRLNLQADKMQWSDVGVDAIGQSTSRINRTQVVPSILSMYKLRFRATNNKSLTVPVAKITQIVKSGTTTWTVTTAAAHGLSTGDYINLYGNRDTVNFPNLTTATVVASIVDATNFTVISTTGTATGYGGTVYRVNGGNLPSTLGAISMVVQTIVRTSNIVTATFSASFSGALIGDYVNLHGVRSAVDGSDIGIDGAYRIQNINAAVVTLEPIAGFAPTGADIGSINTGGTCIKRTDLRISYVRAFTYDRLRTEIVPRPGTDLSMAMPVSLNGATVTVSASNLSCNAAQWGGQTVVTGGLNGTVGVGGAAAHSAATTTNPITCGGRVVPITAATVEATLTAGDASHLPITTGYQVITKANGTAELDVSSVNSLVPTVWASAANLTQVAPASGTANVRTYVSSLQIGSDALGGATSLWLLDGAVAISSATVATPGVFTSGTHDFKVGDAVVLQGLATLAVTGVAANQVVYVATVPSTTTFTLALTKGGTGVAVSASGTATAYRILAQARLQTAALPLTPITLGSPVRTAPNVALSLLCSATQTGTVYANTQGYYGF